MAELVWTEPALEQLDDIAAYIALHNPSAARRLVQLVVAAAENLVAFPHSGRPAPELPGLHYRELLLHPCRIIYRVQGQTVYVVHVTRQERLLRRYLLQV